MLYRVANICNGTHEHVNLSQPSTPDMKGLRKSPTESHHREREREGGEGTRGRGERGDGGGEKAGRLSNR